MKAFKNIACRWHRTMINQLEYAISLPMTNEQNKQINPERIYHAYSELFPSEFEFLILHHLYVNYPSEEMQYSDIRQAILDTSRLPFINTGRERQLEKTFKGLLRTFIERVPSRPSHFMLTPHAEKLVEIATHRIANPYLKYPLKETFETYFALPPDAADDIKKLQAWFKFGFQNNARQVVIGHLDGLKLSVDDSVKALNHILEADDLSAMQMLEQFSGNFKTLGDKARQITEAIRMKVDVHYQLRDTVERLMTMSTVQGNIAAGDEMLQDSRHIALQIKEEVLGFFEKVDNQLDIVNLKLGFATSKISELQDSLRTKSQYKLNLKKLLVYLLENSKPDPLQWIRLPSAFQPAGFVSQKFRFRSIRYYDMGFLRRGRPVEPDTDEAYEESQRNLFEQELSRQAVIQQYCDRVHQELGSGRQLDLSQKMFEIMDREDSVETGIQTAYEVIRNLSGTDELHIEKKFVSSETNSIHVWKTMIHPHRQNLNS